MCPRAGTSRRIHHATDHLDDSLDAAMQIEQMIEAHGPAWTESALMAMAKTSDRAGVREIVRQMTGKGQG